MEKKRNGKEKDRPEAVTERERTLLHIIRESVHSEELISFALSLISQLEIQQTK